MFYIKPKGSQHLFLMDFNEKYNLPVWTNRKEWAIHSYDFKLMCKIADFIEKNGTNCVITF